MSHNAINTEHEYGADNTSCFTERAATCTSRRQQRRAAKLAGKSCMARAWGNIKGCAIAGQVGVTDADYCKCLSVNYDNEAPISWLLDLDDSEFESLLREIRLHRAYARLLGGAK